MLSYVREMRKFIGHRPLMMCGATVIIVNSDGQVLMEQRTDNNCWCFPGGAIEPGETLEDAATREAFEETGLRIRQLEIFGVFSGEELHYVYPNQDEVYIVDTVYMCSSYDGEIVVNDESKTIMFFNIEDIPDEISPPVIPVVRALKKRFSISK